jgi:hypothetical protein
MSDGLKIEERGEEKGTGLRRVVNRPATCFDTLEWQYLRQDQPLPDTSREGKAVSGAGGSR